MLRGAWLSVVPLLFVGCATGQCPQNAKAEGGAAVAPAASSGTTGATAKPASKKEAAMKPESKLDRVKVYKPDGSLQCGQGKAIPVAEMQKDLGDIKVFSGVNKNDGMMRIQVCGSPTGNANVYEIERKSLEAAVKKGFKEWTFDN